ncbi:hypothetical protein BaRGS_00033720, partial [Batillaria attramentaria]
MSYSTLSRAQLSFDYLHTNSTTHEFLFGALAELLDNARDASATKINIYTVADNSLRGGYAMCFLDDGEGMDPSETADIVTFGKSSKRCVDSQHIGMYGNGLKSGSMRIGNDLILFTKKGLTMSCLFLSRTFHEEENIDEVIVPLPVFEASTRRPLAKGVRAQERHDTEMGLIYKYSPFRTEDDFFAQFDRIEGNSGTLVVIFNLKLLDDGHTELDMTTNATDILLANPESDYDSDEGLMPERRSFRAYASILYMEPRMRIYIQGKKVHTKRLASCLYKPRLYKYSSNRFKTRTENEAKNLENKFGSALSKDQRTELRKAQTTAAEYRREADIKRQIAERKVKALRDPKTLNLIFGVNLENRSHDGVFVYNCTRLIKMYEKVGPQTEGGVFCSGVVGIVDVPYLVLEPTHNKQDFADAKEYRHLMKAMGEHMVQYWKDIGIAQQGVTKFWEGYGYISSRWRDPPSTDIKYVRKRAMQINKTLQCVQHEPRPTTQQMYKGILKKEIKSSEQKKKDLEEEIKKKQEMLAKMQKTQVVLSNKDVQDVGRRPETKARAPSPPPAPAAKPTPRRQSAPPAPKRQPSPPPRRQPSPPPKRQPPPPKRQPSPPAPRSRAVSTPAPKPKPAPVKSAPPPKAPPPKPAPKTVSKPEPKPAPAPRQTANSRATAVISNAKPDVIRRSPSPKLPSANRKRGAATPVNNTPSRVKAAARGMTTRVEEVVVEPPKAAKSKPPPGVFMSSGEEENEASQSGMEAMEVDTHSAANDSQVVVNDADSNGEIGTRVEAMINNKWHGGVVVRVNAAEAKWKVKFDSYPKDKYDKWYEKQSSDIRIIKGDEPEAKPPLSPESQVQETAEAPTSSTATSAASSTQNMDEIANGYRTCLRYFLPPQWVMDKETISAMSLQELADFPLDDFFDHYERGLRRLVSNFQTEAAVRKQEAENAKSKLASVRKLIAKLLKSTNE